MNARYPVLVLPLKQPQNVPQRSYHLTGCESYYGVLADFKPLGEFILQISYIFIAARL